MAKVTKTSSRKSEHIRVNLEENVTSGITTGLENYRLPHEALPEIDLNEVSLQTQFLGKELTAPLLISSMTGGSKDTEAINIRLAEAAQESGIAMGLGSQRAALEDDELARTFQVRRAAPNILLFANIGAVQLNYGYGQDECKRAVEMAEADALYLHLNSVQEAVQPEGDSNFSGLLNKINELSKGLGVPILVKEVGWGISGATAKRLIEAGVAGIDVAGAGGTSWSQVEMHRAERDSQARVAASFIDWGIPTSDALEQIRAIDAEIELVASGGLRNGVDIAKCIALGANLAGMANPFLKAADQSTEAVIAEIDEIKTVLSIAMFATGCTTIEQLADINLSKVN